MKRLIWTGLAMVLCAAGAASAQQSSAYPLRPLRIVVPITSGSATDILVRAVAERIRLRVGQPVVVDNRPGAGTTIGAAAVAKSQPDGYTILANSSAHTANPFLYRDLPYDARHGFVGVTPLASLPNILVVTPGSQYHSVRELVAAARRAPGKLNYASAGTGSGTHMNAEKFRLGAGIAAEHIPYKGTPEALVDTMTGRVQWFFAPGVAALGVIQEKKLRALAVGSKERLSLLPDVPTTEQAGVANSAYNFWVGLFVPARTPPQILTRLNKEVVSALESADVRESFTKIGADPMPMTLEAFKRFLDQEFIVNEQLVKAAGIKLMD